MYPILEFDDTCTALIEPGMTHAPVNDLPERCVLCFFNDVIGSICTDDHRVQRNLCRATLCHVALSARIAPSGPQNREGHKAPCYPECYSSRPLAES